MNVPSITINIFISISPSISFNININIISTDIKGASDVVRFFIPMPVLLLLIAAFIGSSKATYGSVILLSGVVQSQC